MSGNNFSSSPLTNYLSRNGFVMVSNLLIEYQQELGITDLEFNFIIKIMKNKVGFYIHDRDLDPTVSSRTLQRRRASLKQKGLLKFTVIKKQNPDTGCFATEGISYDLSPLEEKLQLISDKIEERKKAENKQIVVENKLITEEIEDSPLEDYKKDYENCYGIPYVLNEYEINKYNSLSEENKKMISYIFLYCKQYDLLGKIVPRLSLFFKTSFRFAELRKFCLENGYINETNFKTNVEIKQEKEEAEKEDKFEEEQKDINRIAKEIYNHYYGNENDNKLFMIYLIKIVGRHYNNGELPNIDFYVRSAYEKTKKKN